MKQLRLIRQVLKPSTFSTCLPSLHFHYLQLFPTCGSIWNSLTDVSEVAWPPRPLVIAHTWAWLCRSVTWSKQDFVALRCLGRDFVCRLCAFCGESSRVVPVPWEVVLRWTVVCPSASCWSRSFGPANHTCPLPGSLKYGVVPISNLSPFSSATGPTMNAAQVYNSGRLCPAG